MSIRMSPWVSFRQFLELFVPGSTAVSPKLTLPRLKVSSQSTSGLNVDAEITSKPVFHMREPGG